jgi:hypothetical protein
MALDTGGLRAGQAVAVRELPFGCEIEAPADGEAGLAVVEVGPEHLVLENPSSGSRTSIPLYLIRKPPKPQVRRPAA